MPESDLKLDEKFFSEETESLLPEEKSEDKPEEKKKEPAELKESCEPEYEKQKRSGGLCDLRLK